MCRPKVVKDKEWGRRVYPHLHGGLKALVAPDRAGREAVPNRVFSLRKKVDSAESRFHESIRDATKKVFPADAYYWSLIEREDSGPTASRQIKKQ